MQWPTKNHMIIDLIKMALLGTIEMLFWTNV